MWCCEAAGHVSRRSNSVDGASASDVFSISVALVRLSVRRRARRRRLSYGVEVELGREHGAWRGHGSCIGTRRVAPALFLFLTGAALLSRCGWLRRGLGNALRRRRVVHARLAAGNDVFFLWLRWVRLVRALERFLLLPCVNEMPDDERLQLTSRLHACVGRAKRQAAREQQTGRPPRRASQASRDAWKLRLVAERAAQASAWLASCKTLASYAPAL